MTLQFRCSIYQLRNILQIEMALDAFKRNNVTLEWFSIPHNDECVYDMSPSCKDDF